MYIDMQEGRKNGVRRIIAQRGSANVKTAQYLLTRGLIQHTRFICRHHVLDVDESIFAAMNFWREICRWKLE